MSACYLVIAIDPARNFQVIFAGLFSESAAQLTREGRRRPPLVYATVDEVCHDSYQAARDYMIRQIVLHYSHLGPFFDRDRDIRDRCLQKEMAR